jgi:hypothetical protein
MSPAARHPRRRRSVDSPRALAWENLAIVEPESRRDGAHAPRHAEALFGRRQFRKPEATPENGGAVGYWYGNGVGEILQLAPTL